MPCSFFYVQVAIAFEEGQVIESGKKRSDNRAQEQKNEQSPQISEAIKKLKADLENELLLREINIKRLSENFRKRHELYSQGIISRKEIEEEETTLKSARSELEARRQKITS